MTLIRGTDLTLGYDGQGIISGLSFSVDDGDYLCIVGENGSGKSTFVKTVLGLVEPLKGTIEYCGGLKRNEIGYFPQVSGIQRDFPSSVMEVVLSGCLNRHHSLFYTRAEKKRAEEELCRLGMDRYSSSSFQELSGGQQQRVAIARAVAAKPPIIMADEPTGNLDSRSGAEIMQQLIELNKGGTSIILITHDNKLAEVAQRIITIQDGKIISDRAGRGGVF